jgi:glycosyltransferase involved in cell wall biosynthesis
LGPPRQSRKAVITISCAAPPGQGDLGRQFAELIDDLRWQGRLRRYYSTGLDGSGPAPEGCLIPQRKQWTPLRFGRGPRTFDAWDEFDRRVAPRLEKSDAHVGFAGQSRHTFLRARRLGCAVLQLVAVTGHVEDVARRHAEALSRWPLEDAEVDERRRRKLLDEYEMSDVILVSSEHARRSFLAAGVPEGKLRLWQARPDPRFQPSGRKPDDDVFRIVFVGTISVLNGVPVLLEALEAIPRQEVELTLVGDWSSGAVRRYVEEGAHRDRRIRMVAGDPLPHLRRADVLVHPGFDDGSAYGPLEALACDVPVIASEDAAVAEQIQPDVTGWVVPTGSVEALVDRLEALIATPKTARQLQPV